MAATSQAVAAAATYLQERMWAGAVDGRSNESVPALWRLEGTLDDGALQTAVDRVVARHESLRTTLVADADGRVLQRIAPDRRVVVERASVSPSRAAADGVVASLNEPFDLRIGEPLLRVRVESSGRREHRLQLVAHHAVVDGWSMAAVGRQLLDACQRALAGAPPGDHADEYQLADVAAWEASLERSELLEGWRQALAGAAQPARAVAIGRAQRASRVLVQRSVRPPAPLAVERLRRLAGERGAGDAALACALAVLALASADDRTLLIGLVDGGRAHPQLTTVVGCSIAVLPLAIELDRRASLADLLDEVRRELVRARRQALPPGALHRGRGALPHCLATVNVSAARAGVPRPAGRGAHGEASLLAAPLDVPVERHRRRVMMPFLGSLLDFDVLPSGDGAPRMIVCGDERDRGLLEQCARRWTAVHELAAADLGITVGRLLERVGAAV